MLKQVSFTQLVILIASFNGLVVVTILNKVYVSGKDVKGTISNVINICTSKNCSSVPGSQWVDSGIH